MTETALNPKGKGLAHIIHHPGATLGTKALALCGTKWTVTHLWEDIPEDVPVCRECTVAAVEALRDAEDQLLDAMQAWARLDAGMNRMLDTLTADNLLSQVVEETAAYAQKQQDKADRKAAVADAEALLAEEGKAKKKKSKKSKSKDAPTAPTYESQHTTPEGGPNTVDS